MTTTKKGSRGSSPNTDLTSALYTPSLSQAISDFQDAVYSDLKTRPSVDKFGELIRFQIAGDKSGSKNGWLIFHTTPIFSAGYGSWKTGLNSTWTYKTHEKLSHSQQQELKRVMAETKAKRQEEQLKKYREAEAKALSIWGRSKPARSNHKYAVSKRMSVQGLRQLRDSLVIPLFQGGKITSLQFITEDGTKRLLTGGKVQGSCFIWGNVRAPFDVCYIAEGVSTAYAVHVLSDYKPVFAAISAGNLERVAVAVRKKWADVKIVLASDNDCNHKGINPGVEFATKAAKACGGEVSIPSMLSGEKCDWADLRLKAMGVKS